MSRFKPPSGLQEKLYQPAVPRANIAASAEHPMGTPKWARENRKKSVLEQHVKFFDPDGDGIIWPQDTFWAFWKLGYHIFWAFIAIFIIHVGFSWFTSDSWIPDPFFRITVKNIHRAKHGSDTGTYDTEGRFIPYNFASIFAKFGGNDQEGLTWINGLKMICENRTIGDPTGWTAAFFEWLSTYLLIWPKDGVVRKESMRKIYDGSIFYEIAEQEKNRSQLPFSGFFKSNQDIYSPD